MLQDCAECAHKASDQGERTLVLTLGAHQLIGAALAGISGLKLALPVLQPEDEVRITWRLHMSDGTEFSGLPSIAAVWQWPPYFLDLRLVAVSGIMPPVVLATAVLGTRIDLRRLRWRVARAVRDMVAGGLDLPRGVALDSMPTPLSRGMFALAVGSLRHVLHRLQCKLVVETWGVGVVRMPLADILSRDPTPVEWLSAGTLGDLADPFCLPGSDHILLEQLPRDLNGVGRILSVQVGAVSQVACWSEQAVTLGHHSYPFVIVIGDLTLFLPEAPGRGLTMLYAVEPAGTLRVVCAVGPDRCMADPTLFEHGGRFWIAYTDLDLDPHDNLCLLYAEALAGPWTAHRRNPVKVDIRSARPAGMPFRVAGEMFRPAQDCAAGYGAAVVINRIDLLTENDYVEQPVRRVQPDVDGPYPHGLHTISGDRQRLLLDGKRLVIRPRALLQKILRRVWPKGRLSP